MQGLFFRHLVLLCALTLASSVTHAQDSVQFDDDLLTPGIAVTRSIAVPGGAQLWPGGIIPYSIEASLPASSKNAISNAIEHWNKVGGISLLPVSEVQRRSGEYVQDSVHFITGEHCASWVGRRGGQQELWVAPNCPTGSVMHEIGHLLGLEHEHTRPDRDQYIQIHWDNIKPDKRHNFETAPAGSRMPGSYDVNSIMHYGSHNFSSNGLSTITLLDGSVGSIGQRIAPSQGDLQAVAELYGSDLSLVARTAAVGEGAELDIYVSNQTPQAAHDVTVDIDIGQAGVLLEPENDQWTCVSPAASTMVCKTYLVLGGAVEHLRILLPDTEEQAGVDVQLSSKTPDSDLSNNTSQLASDDVSEPPPREPAPESDAAVALSYEAMAQEDAVAHVSMDSGAIGAGSLLTLLLLLVGQARRRVY